MDYSEPGLYDERTYFGDVPLGPPAIAPRPAFGHPGFAANAPAPIEPVQAPMPAAKPGSSRRTMMIVLCVLAALVVVAGVYVFWYKGIGASFFTGRKKQSPPEGEPPQGPAAFDGFPEPGNGQLAAAREPAEPAKDIHLTNENDDMFVFLDEDDNVAE